MNFAERAKLVEQLPKVLGRLLAWREVAFAACVIGLIIAVASLKGRIEKLERG